VNLFNKGQPGRGVTAGRHQFIVTVPTNPQAFSGMTTRFMGVPIITLGAYNKPHPVNRKPTLTGMLNNAWDRYTLDAYFSKEPTHPYRGADTQMFELKTPVSADAAAAKMISDMKAFQENTKTSPIPYPRHYGALGGYNSNALAQTLLERAGLAKGTVNLPGWDVNAGTRIEPKHFEKVLDVPSKSKAPVTQKPMLAVTQPGIKP
jgi:hypothetical protein